MSSKLQTVPLEAMKVDTRRDPGHLSPETMASLITGGLGLEELLDQVVPHLLAHCPVCLETEEKVEELQREVRHWNDIVFEHEGSQAPELWRRLEALPHAEQVRRVEEQKNLQTWGLCRLLQRKSVEAAGADAARAVQLAELAARASVALDDVFYDRQWVGELQALCLASRGYARWWLGERQGAGRDFAAADARLVECNTGGGLIVAEILYLEAGVRRHEKRFPEAVALLDRAYDEAMDVAPRERDPHFAAQILARKGCCLLESGGGEQAIGCLRQAAGLPVGRRSAKLRLSILRRLILGLVELGQSDAAAALLWQTQDLAAQAGDETEQLRMRRVEARVALALGERSSAEEILVEVAREFLRLGLPREAAAAMLDFATLEPQEGSRARLAQLAEDIMPALGSATIPAARRNRNADKKRRLTPALARRLAGRLRRHWADEW
ncbi:MAG TPA: hypothetical protein VHR45_22840 [Thermoanaerobaculia bacterium]|nr:hypothetical protein [Thermoanaerobaculia bacterium]